MIQPFRWGQSVPISYEKGEKYKLDLFVKGEAEKEMLK